MMAPGDRFCSGCGTSLLTPDAPPVEARVSREEMFAHLRSGETRPATILMSDVTGFSALSSNADPEWVFNLINQVLSELVECLVGHGAHIDNYVGDEVVALFGVPVAQEHSAERALLAGLAMQDRMRALNDERRFGDLQLQIHTGINVGRVMVGPIGHAAHSDYTVIGDSVNVAKRLEDSAPPGEIYISADVRDAVGDGFLFEDVGSLMFAGMERPVQTLRLVAADQALLSQRGPRTEEALGTARHQELAALAQLADAANEGAAAVASVVGPPGIGKSRLIDDWRQSASASSFRTISTTCHACGAYFPLLPLADITARLSGLQLRGWPPSVVGDAAEALEPIAISTSARDVLAQLLELVEHAPQHDLEQLPRRLAGALAEMLAALALDRPLCLIVEDVEWLDDASEAVLVELVGQLGGRVLLVLTARDPAPGWLDAAGVPGISVHRLSRPDMRGLIDEWAGDMRLPRTTVEAICNRADGHPYFARELVRSLRARPGEGSEDEAALPATLEELFLSQLDQLPLPTRRAVQAASILGEPLSLDILPAVLQERDVADEAVRQIVEAGLLKPGSTPDQFVFGPRLLFEVAYSTIPPTQRRSLHRSTADHLLVRIESGEEALVHTAAHHAFLGYADERAIDLLLRSATVYKAQYSLRQAIRAALRVIEIIASLSDAADHTRERLEALLLLAQCHEVIGNLDEAEAAIAEAEVLSEEHGNDELTASVLTTAGTLLLMQGDPDAAEKRYAEALALWQRLNSPTRAAHMAIGMGLCAGQRGECEEAMALFARAATTEGAEDWVRAAAENNLGVMLMELGRYEEAEPHLLRGLAANERDGDRRGVAQSRCSLGELYYRLARLEEAATALMEAAEVAEEAEDAPCLTLAQAWLNRVRCMLGQSKASEAKPPDAAQLPPDCAAAVKAARIDCVLADGDDDAVKDALTGLLTEDRPRGNWGVELLALGLESALVRGDGEATAFTEALEGCIGDATDQRLLEYVCWLRTVGAGGPTVGSRPAGDAVTCFDLRKRRIATKLEEVK